MRLLEKLENRPLKIRCKEDQETIIRSLSGSELELLVDLRPFMQRDPFIVPSDASLSRAYRLFRTMGLRHLFVCPPRPKVCPQAAVTLKGCIKQIMHLIWMMMKPGLCMARLCLHFDSSSQTHAEVVDYETCTWPLLRSREYEMVIHSQGFIGCRSLA